MSSREPRDPRPPTSLDPMEDPSRDPSTPPIVTETMDVATAPVVSSTAVVAVEMAVRVTRARKEIRKRFVLSFFLLLGVVVARYGSDHMIAR